MTKKIVKTGRELERQVADAYRAMGARKVEHDVELAGHQIDVYVEMETADRALHRIAVEAKDYGKPVGIKIVSGFAAVINGLRTLKLVDEGVIISAAGFSRPARSAAQEHGLRLLEPSDLNAMASGQSPAAPAPPTSPASPLGHRVPLGRSPGSPFVVGRPLRGTELIFGRERAFHFVASELAKFSSINVVGERRMGKTSFIHHLMGHQDTRLPPQPDQPPLVLACVDLQASVSNEERFYGLALRELFNHLPPSRSAEARAFEDWGGRLAKTPQASYDELDRALRQLRDPDGVCVCPVLIVDEFQHLLDPEVTDGFPYPYFFDGLRALITAELLAMVVASRRPLVEYFRDPDRPGGLTSTFPSYFGPFTLGPLDDEAADALLLQPSPHRLTIQEAAQARRWAGGHPCHLQAAGQAWYEAKAEGRTHRWTRERFDELKSSSGFTGQAARKRGRSDWFWRDLRRILRTTFRSFPIAIGRLAQVLGARLDDMAAWIIGAVVIVVLVLLLLGVVTGGDLWDVIKKGLGL